MILPPCKACAPCRTDWHWTWKSLERNTPGPRPLLRLSPRQWTLKAIFRISIMRSPPTNPRQINRQANFPFRVTLRVGSGTATVCASSRVELKGFFNEGMIAVDGSNFSKTKRDQSGKHRATMCRL